MAGSGGALTPRLYVSATTAGEVARLRYVLRPGRVLSQEEAIAIVIEEWRKYKQSEHPKHPK